MTPLATSLAFVGIAIGLLGLGIDFWIIMGSPAHDIDGNAVERSIVGQFVYFWTFFTHLTNLGLVLFYLAELTGWRWLSALREPRWRASMAGMIALVMVFFHFMLAPYYTFTGGLLVSNYLLHYVAPVIFLLWWLAAHPARQPALQRPALDAGPRPDLRRPRPIRGAIVNDYPYAILNASKAGYGGVAIGVLIILAAVAVFCTLLVFVDRLLGRRTTA